MANRGQTLDSEVFCIKDLKEAASKKLPKMYREYYNEGAMDMITMRENEAAFDRYRIRPRILVNISNIDTSTEILGSKVAFPLGFSPAAMHKLAHPDGEIGTSRAAAKTNIPMVLSTYSSDSLEDVIKQSQGNPYAMQVTAVRDRNITLQLLKRAEAAGYKAIFLTVDSILLGRRLNEFRNNFRMPDGMKYPNLGLDLDVSSLVGEDNGLAYEDSFDWDEAISFVRQNCKLEIWLKGVYTADDVLLAIKYGLDGVVISNHGGRQLDSVPATLDALRECAPVAKGKIKIGIDSGIRRGTDIFKAIALGADFCFVGRIPIWGLAYKGQAGVELAVNLLLHEFKVCMGLAGCRTVKDITRNHLSLLRSDGILSKI